MLAEPVLSNCGFRYRTDAHQDWDSVNSGIRRLARRTSIVVSSTFVAGSYVLRPCFINARLVLRNEL